MAIDTTHLLYDDNLAVWKQCQDIVNMTNLDKYLVKLNPSDTSVQNTERNAQYVERAIFYAVANRMLNSLVGSVFRKWPTLILPPQLKYLAENADGAGVSIFQQSQKTLGSVLTTARSGLAVTFPDTGGKQVSGEDVQNGKYVATIRRFDPAQIINWRESQYGSRVKLSMVIILEVTEEPGIDGYTVKRVPVIHEMILTNNVYTTRKHTKEENGWVAGVIQTPVDAKGNVWDEIPFTFVGSSNNDPSPDISQMLPIVKLNIGHFRNSADLEDNVWFCGQSQPWMSGLSQSHIDLMNKNKMYVGSRQLMGVPAGGAFGIETSSPNTLTREVMNDKLEAMIAMGARLAQKGSATKTATQASGEQESETSTLSLSASNVSEAYTKCINWASRYMIGTTTETETEPEYTLSQDFVNSGLDSNQIREIAAMFTTGSMPVQDYVRNMRKVGLFDDTTTDEEYALLLSRDSQ